MEFIRNISADNFSLNYLEAMYFEDEDYMEFKVRSIGA